MLLFWCSCHLHKPLQLYFHYMTMIMWFTFLLEMWKKVPHQPPDLWNIGAWHWLCKVSSLLAYGYCSQVLIKTLWPLQINYVISLWLHNSWQYVATPTYFLVSNNHLLNHIIWFIICTFCSLSNVGSCDGSHKYDYWNIVFSRFWAHKYVGGQIIHIFQPIISSV